MESGFLSDLKFLGGAEHRVDRIAAIISIVLLIFALIFLIALYSGAGGANMTVDKMRRLIAISAALVIISGLSSGVIVLNSYRS